MTATLTPDEQLVQTPEDTVLFMCRRSDLRLTKTARYPVFGAAGQKVDETRGEVVAFRAGVFRCPKEGAVMLEDGREADAAEIVAWLERHRLFSDIEDGFWRVDPSAPPIGGDEIKALMDLVLKLDDEGIERFIEQETAGWNREDLLDTATTSLEQVRAVKKAAAEGQA